MESIVFDGIALTDTYRVFAKRGLPYHKADVREIPGRDGVMVAGADYAPPSLSLYFVLGPCMRGEMERKVHDLSHLLDVREPKKLELGDDGGLWCMAMPTGERNWKRHVTSASVEVPFVVCDAAMYGREMSVTVPSGGTASFTVNGTYPTRPMVEAASAKRDEGSKVWGLILDDADFLHIATGTSSATKVEADCGERTVSIGGTASVPTLNSDWLELEPGRHELRMDYGTGAATVTWFERWL